MTGLPDGYVKTGDRDGYPVCCREVDFVHFTGGIATDHLGFVFKNGKLVPLQDYILGLEPGEERGVPTVLPPDPLEKASSDWTGNDATPREDVEAATEKILSETGLKPDPSEVPTDPWESSGCATCSEKESCKANWFPGVGCPKYST